MTLIEDFERDPVKITGRFRILWAIIALMILAVCPSFQMAANLAAGTITIFTTTWLAADNYKRRKMRDR